MSANLVHFMAKFVSAKKRKQGRNWIPVKWPLCVCVHVF